MSKRSILLDGAVTSISMEDPFWHELDRYSHEKGMEWAEVVRKWLASAPPSENRSASIKEIILRLLRHEVDRLQGAESVKLAQWEIRLANTRKPRTIQTHGTQLIVGREWPAEVIVEDEEVSRRHAMLIREGNRWWVLDLKSKNGTLVGGERVSAAELKLGATFMVGQALVKLVTNS